jgi:hypothetical protein
VSEPRAAPRLIVSYLALRRVVGALGIGMPIVLFSWGWLSRHVWLPSLSAYYALRTRDVFVGCLFSIGCFLYAYRGHDRHDDIVTHVAGTCAILVALIPSIHPGVQHQLHFVFATTLFLLLAYISYFRFTRQDDHPTAAKLMRNTVYRWCAIAMILCMLLVAVVDVTKLDSRLSALRPVFLLETAALWAFGLSWVVKGGALWRDPSIVAPPRRL